jgi:hypothetical protein
MAPLPNTEAYVILSAYQTDLSESRREVIWEVARFSFMALAIMLGATGPNDLPVSWACRILLIPMVGTIPYAIRNLLKRNQIAKNEVMAKIVKHLTEHRWVQFEKSEPIPGQPALYIQYHAENRV